MITQILLYLGTIFLTEWIIIFAGIIPNLILGILNNSTGGKFPPNHPLYFVFNTVPAIVVLYLFDLVWKCLSEQHIPLVILPVLIFMHLRSMKSTGANASNIYQAKTALVGILIFIPIHIALVGIQNLNWY